MKISVVIPNYNGSRTLLRVIENVVEQLSDDSEVILLDDCSTDESVDLKKKTYPRVTIFENSLNEGAAAVRNIGMNRSHSMTWRSFRRK